MPTDKEVLHGVLSTLFKIDKDGVAALYNADETELNPDALQVILDKDAERLQGLKPDTKKYFDDGYKKGQSESLSKFEKEAKAKFGLQSDKQGIDLLEDLVAKYKEDHPEDPEKIKKSKFYIDAVEEFNKKLSETETGYKTELDNFKKTVERKELFGNVSNKALIIFENLKPILPEDAAKAANLKQVFINDLAGLNYTTRDGEIVLLDKDGNDLVNRHHHRIKFEDYVKETAEKYFDFYKAEGKSAPTHAQNNNKSNSTVFIVSSEADFAKQMETANAETRPLILDAYNDAKSKGKF